MILCLICAGLDVVSANDLWIESKSHIDWEAQVLILELRVDLRSSEKALPLIRAEVENQIRDNLPESFMEAVYSIPVDSSQVVGDKITADAAIFTLFHDLGDAGTRVYGRMNPEFTLFETRYDFSLFPDFAKILIEHTRRYKPEPMLEFVPTTEYTGLVIFVPKELSVHGENGIASLKPSLFPRIFDENMRLVAEIEMMDPPVASARGMAIFTRNQQLRKYLGRVGEVPLITMARSLFGTNRTDLLIPTRAADRLLASEKNIQLLQEGRILIILGN